MHKFFPINNEPTSCFVIRTAQNNWPNFKDKFGALANYRPARKRNCQSEKDVVKGATDGLTKSVSVRARPRVHVMPRRRDRGNKGCNPLRLQKVSQGRERERLIKIVVFQIEHIPIQLCYISRINTSAEHRSSRMFFSSEVKNGSQKYDGRRV